MTYPKDRVSLVADVGGTNTRVALADGARLLPETVRKVKNEQADSLEAVLADYVDSLSVDCVSAAVAIAGPVDKGRGTLTNLDWSIDEEILARVTKAETAAVLNDLQAQAYASADLKPENLRRVLPGMPGAPDAPRLMIGFGTGLNAALALPTPKGQIVPASECGHITMPVRSEEDLRLAAFVGRANGMASAEDVLSGRGVAHIYDWLAEEAGTDQKRDGAEIVDSAVTGDDALATRTVEVYVRTMARFVSDLALVHLPFNGIYMIGGVARAMAPHLERFGFAESFSDKGRFSDFMARFPVSIVEDDFAALHGLARRLDEMREI